MGYFFALLKKNMRWIPAMLLMTVLLAAILGIFLSAKLSAAGADVSAQKMILGVIGDTEDEYFQMGLRIAQEMDNSRNTVSFVFMEEDQAKAALARQEIHGYLVIPEDFVDSVMRGENKKATLVTGTSQENIGMLLVREIADTVSVLLTESQTGIYSFSEYMEQTYGEMPDNDAVWRLNLRYFDLILPRDEIYAMDTPDSMTALSLQGYYLCAVAVLFMLFLGIAGCPLLVREDNALNRLLLFRGKGAVGQCLSEYGAWCLTMLAVYGIVFLAVAVGLVFLGDRIPELAGASLIDVGYLILAFAWLVPVICGLQYILCQMTRSLLPGMLLCFCCAAGLGYLTGCFYPLSFWPISVQHAAAVLPTGLLMEYMGRILTGEPAISLVPGMIAWLVGFLGLACILRKWEFSR